MTAAPRPRRIVFVTGLSGAGKASILRTLEDVGFQAIDNLPIDLIATVAGAGQGPLAVGVDARGRDFSAAGLLQAIDVLRTDHALAVDLVFATASQDVLLRRYTETRRRHPLAPSGRVIDGILAESKVLGGLTQAADLTIDTSDLPPPALRSLIEARFGGAGGLTALTVTLMSFAFPAGLPRDADLVFDARFLRNPHYITALKPLTGLDSAVGSYIAQDPDYSRFLGKLLDMLQLLLPRFVQEGKRYVTVGIGCTGGRHRSVFVVESLAAALASSGWRVTRAHRELGADYSLPMPIYADVPLLISHAPAPTAPVPAGLGSVREA